MYKYREIVRDIESSIANGTLKPYSKLPPVTELCLAYDVSRSTINQALQVLSDEGLVSRRQGSGVYVKPLDMSTIGWKMSGQAAGVFPRADRVSRHEKINVIDLSVVRPDEKISRILDIDSQSFIYVATRIHANETLATCVEYCYVPVGLVGQLSLQELADDVVSLVEQKTGISVGSFQKTVRSVMPSHAERAHLRIEMETPLLEVETVGFLSDGRAFGLSVRRFPGTRFEFRTIDASPNIIATIADASADTPL